MFRLPMLNQHSNIKQETARDLVAKELKETGLIPKEADTSKSKENNKYIQILRH